MTSLFEHTWMMTSDSSRTFLNWWAWAATVLSRAALVDDSSWRSSSFADSDTEYARDEIVADGGGGGCIKASPPVLMFCANFGSCFERPNVQVSFSTLNGISFERGLTLRTLFFSAMSLGTPGSFRNSVQTTFGVNTQRDRSNRQKKSGKDGLFVPALLASKACLARATYFH